MLKTEKIIKEYIDYVELVKKSADLKTNNIIGELAENYVIEKLGLTKSETNKKHYDAHKGKTKYQIKYRTPSKKGTIRTSFKNIDGNSWNVDKLVIVLHTLEIFIIDKKHIEAMSKKSKNGLLFKTNLKELKNKNYNF